MRQVDKNPADVFFWSDYEHDEALRLCSLAAQGLWMRMLCLMARSQPRGYLRLGDRALSPRDLARCAGCTEEETVELMQELEAAGVYSRDRHGTPYCRRMVRTDALAKKRSEIGAEGARRRWGTSRSGARRKSSLAPKGHGNTDGAGGGKMMHSSFFTPPLTPPGQGMPEGMPEGMPSRKRRWLGPVAPPWPHETWADACAGVEFASPALINRYGEEDWQPALRLWLRADAPAEKRWTPAWGPPPGEPGCRVPENALAPIRARLEADLQRCAAEVEA